MKVKVYSIIIFLNSYLSGLLVPILSLLLIEKGASLSNLSIVMGIYAATVIVLELPTGIMADVIGRKKTFCLSLFVSLLSFLFILIGHGVLIMCIGIILYGVSRALFSGSFDALFIDSYIDTFGKDKLHSITTRLSVLSTLGLSVGALSGGFFPKIVNDRFPSLGTYDLNLIIRIVLTIIVAALSIIFITDTATIQKEERISLKQHINNCSSFVTKNSTVICIFISVFATGFFISALETYWQPHMKSLLPDNRLMILLGIMAFLYFAAAMIGSILSNKIMNKFRLNSRIMFIILRLLLAVSLILTAIQTNIGLFITLYSTTYLLFGMANIPEAVILNGEIPNKIRASVLSVNSLILQVGVLTGSLVDSIIIDYVSLPQLWIIGAIVIILTILVTFKKLIGKPSNSDNESF